MYRSFAPWQSDQERLQTGTQFPASAGLADSGGSPGIGSAGAPVSDVGSGQPGALRAFFEANRSQGAGILGGLANRFNQQVATTQAGLTQPLSTGQELPLIPQGGMPAGAEQGVENVNAQIAAYNEQQRKNAEANKQTQATNQATAQGLAQDWNRLGTQEGQQSLLEQQLGSSGYTPGQARLDAWLAGSAANTNPNILGTAGANYNALQTQANATPSTDPNAVTKWMEQKQQEARDRIRQWVRSRTR